MSGYREHSYDPGAYERPGPPMRPFNWVQWMGVGAGALGLALYGLYFAGRVGWIREFLDSPMISLPFLMLGVVLVNSRRKTTYDPAPELAQARRRWMLIVLTLCALIFGVAIVLELTGVAK